MSAPGKVTIGPTTAFGGTVTVAAFATAIVAFANGARDEETFSALAVGALSLLTTLGGRYGQAIAQALSYGTGAAQPVSGAAYAIGPEGNVQYGSGLVAGESGTSNELRQRAAEVHAEAMQQTPPPRRSRKKG